MSKDNLDNLFQQKANNRSFEFEDEYWNEMELLLEEEEDKKRFIFWWWNGKFLLGSLLAVVAMGLLYWLLNSGNFNQNQQLSQSERENIAQNEQNSSSNSSETETKLAIQENSSTKNSIDGTPETSEQKLNDNTLNNSSNTTTNRSSNNQSSNSVKSAQRDSRNRNRQPNQLNTSSNSKNRTGNNSQNTKHQNNTSSSTSSNPSNSSTSNPSFFDDGKGKGVGNSSSNDASKPNGSISDKATTDASNTSNPSKNEAPSLEISKITDALELLELIDLENIDNISEANLPAIPDRLKPLKEKQQNKETPKYPVTIGAEVGLNRYWHNLDAQNATPYNFTGGIDFNIPIPLKFNNDLSLGLGANYWSRGNLNASQTEDSTVYSFGFQTISITKSIEKSYFLEISFSLNYRLAKHELMLGASYSYLLTARGTTSTTIFSDFETISLPSSTTFGFKNWLSSYDIAAQFGYKYFWSEKGYIGIEGKYGLRDLTPTAIYGDDIFDRNLQVRLLLGYHLFQLGK